MTLKQETLTVSVSVFVLLLFMSFSFVTWIVCDLCGMWGLVAWLLFCLRAPKDFPKKWGWANAVTKFYLRWRLSKSGIKLAEGVAKVVNKVKAWATA